MMLPFTETQSKNPETEKSNASKLTPRYQKRVQNGWVVILTGSCMTMYVCLLVLLADEPRDKKDRKVDSQHLAECKQ